MRARILPAVAACLVLTLVGGGAWWLTGRSSTVASAVGGEPLAREVHVSGRPWVADGTQPVALLRAWDARRAAAYATADVAALRRLYVAGSAAGRRDVHALRSYRARGLRVIGLTTQLISVEPRSTGRSSGRELVLRVDERMTGAVAVGRGRRVRLPASVVRSRVVTLVRTDVRSDQGWLVASVRPGPGG